MIEFRKLFMKKITHLVLLVPALLGGGCFNSLAESAIEGQIEAQTGGQAQVDLSGESVTYTDTETGGTVALGANLTLPSDFPADILIYEGEITLASASNVPGEGASLVFTTSESAAVIADWYKAKLIAAGWSEAGTFDLQGTSLRSYEKDGVTISLSLMTKDSVTTVVVARVEE